jgi:hypothetical protein
MTEYFVGNAPAAAAIPANISMQQVQPFNKKKRDTVLKETPKRVTRSG